MTDNLTCSMCQAPDGVIIWRLPKSGKWSDGTKDELDQLVWHNKHGVSTSRGLKAGVKNAQVVTTHLLFHAEGGLVCGWCRARFTEQKELFKDV